MLTAWGGGNLLVMNAAEPGLQGSTQGLMSVVQALSMATLPTVGGALWNASLAFPGAWHAGFCNLSDHCRRPRGVCPRVCGAVAAQPPVHPLGPTQA